MTISPFAGKPAPAQLLVDIPRLVTAYYTGQPDAAISTQRVAFDTLGLTVQANGLADGKHVPFIEAQVERAAAVQSGSAKDLALRLNGRPTAAAMGMASWITTPMSTG